MHFLPLADSFAVAVMSYVDHEDMVSCHTGVGISSSSGFFRLPYAWLDLANLRRGDR